MQLAQVDIYTHFFKLTKIHPFLIQPIKVAIDELTQVQYFKIRGRVQKQATKTYATATSDYSEFRFHINFLPRFKEILANHRLNFDNNDSFLKVEHALYEPAEVTLKMPDSIIMRDYQESAINYCLEDGISKLITFPPGYGKTYTALKLNEIMSSKLIIVVLGRYLEKWTEDVIGAYGKDCDYVVIKGSNDLIKLLMSCEAGNTPPAVTILSTTTLQNFIKSYEQASFEERSNMIDPTRLCEILKVGMKLVDEAHQHFHANFKMDLYTHCPKTLSLTATLESQDRFMQNMYQLMWPLHTRTERVKPAAYDNTFALHYRHRDPSKVRHMGNQGYSHVMYEQSIWKHIPSRLAYLEMIGDTVEEGFLPYYKPGRKMLIFCSLVETCDQVAEYLSKRFAEKKWQISRFIAGDPKELIDTNDITVSTLGKAGTALDVYGLITCLMTVALSEPKANIQAKGRLRNIQMKEEFADVVPKFYYFVADDLEKPRQYYEQKKILFADRTLKQTDEYLRITVGDPISELYPNGIPEYVKEKK